MISKQDYENLMWQAQAQAQNYQVLSVEDQVRLLDQRVDRLYGIVEAQWRQIRALLISQGGLIVMVFSLAFYIWKHG
jgi:hypothetical protein